jgi:hypothetical protein
MDESFSSVIFLYGMALVVAVGKAFTLLIWRTLPKPRPPLRQEMLEAWQRQKARVQAAKEAAREKPPAACSSAQVSDKPEGLWGALQQKTLPFAGQGQVSPRLQDVTLKTPSVRHATHGVSNLR